MPVTVVRLTRSRDAAGELIARLGVPLDEYLEFLAGRCRPNTVLAVAYDLKVFFTVVAKPPRRVRPADVLGFMTAQHTGGEGRLQVAEPGAGVGPDAAAAVVERVGAVWVLACPRRCDGESGAAGAADALTAALRTHRDRAMVAAMVLGGLRRCEVIGLRLDDLRFGERRLFVAEGNGGHQRLVSVSPRFFAEVSAYLDAERLAGAGTDRVFVVLKGPRRGLPLSADGLDEILDGAPARGPGWPMRPAISCGTPA